MASNDLGLVGAARGAGAAAALRQLIADRLAAEQTQFTNQQAADKLQMEQALNDARLKAIQDQSVQGAADRAQGLYLPGQLMQPGDVAALTAAGRGALIGQQDATLPSESVTGGVTLPSAASEGAATVTPMQPVGPMTDTISPGQQAGPIFTGTPAQQQAEQQQQVIRGYLRSLPADSPMRSALQYRMATGANPPAGALPSTGTDVNLQPKPVMVNGQRVLANFNPRTGTYTDLSGKVLQNVQPDKADTSYGSAIGALLAGADPKAIADGIEQGDVAPDPNGLNRYVAPAVVTELHKRGFNLAKAESDWKATQKYLSTLNGAAQIRLRQAVQFTADSLPKLEELNAQWKGGAFPPLNRARLLAAKNGAMGPEAQGVATQLLSQIAELQSELAVVYRGGNAPTDGYLEQAHDVLEGDWSEPQLQKAIDLVKANIGYRLNSIKTSGVIGSADNPYAGQVGQPAGLPGSPSAVPQGGGSDPYADYLKKKGSGG